MLKRAWQELDSGQPPFIPARNFNPSWPQVLDASRAIEIIVCGVGGELPRTRRELFPHARKPFQVWSRVKKGARQPAKLPFSDSNIFHQHPNLGNFQLSPVTSWVPLRPSRLVARMKS